MRDAPQGQLRPATPPFSRLSGARAAGPAELTRVQGRVLRGDNVTYWVRGSPGGWVERGWRAEVTVGQVGLRGVGPVQRLRVPTIGGEVMGSRATTFGPVEPNTGGGPQV